MRRFVALSAISVVGMSVLVVLPSSPAAAFGPVACSGTFTAAGETQCTVGADVTALTVEAIGGAGASDVAAVVAGGSAADVTATIPVSSDETLYIEVDVGGSQVPYGGDGGGASDVRTCSVSDYNCVLTAGADDPRLVVAGGGGGGAHGGNAGYGGDAGVSDVVGAGDGGTGESGPPAVAGGAGGVGAGGGVGGGSNSSGSYGDHGFDGSPGYGGNVRLSHSWGGGGGGGFNGGGGGGDGDENGGGGGAGSSFVESTATGTPTVTTADVSATPEVVLTPGQAAPTGPYGAVTSTQLSLSPNPAAHGQSVTATATVSPTTVSGSYQFALDGMNVGDPQRVSASQPTATLVLPGPLSDGQHQVLATYSGDDFYDGSSDSETLTVSGAAAGVTDPTITAHLASGHRRTAAGWYRGPVTITYTCAQGSAPLNANGCPAPVTLTGDSKKRRVTRTVRATDGGSARVTTTVRIDQQTPHLHIHGVSNGETYRHTRTIRCTATDALSGLARPCRVRTHRHGHKIHYKATATDNAGNTKHKKGHYSIKH
jgi:hypothetical protein